MSDPLIIQRTFNANPETVFRFVTEAEFAAQWWGPESMFVARHNLDLTRNGPWFAVIENQEGGRHHVSGEVIEVSPTKSVTFTWAWHNGEDGERGHESQVRFEVAPAEGGGTAFTLTQSGFADEEARANHNVGWSSSIIKLEALASK